MQRDRSPLHRVDQAVDCGLWNVVPLVFNGCVTLLDIGWNWNKLSYTTIQIIPKQAHWVTCLVSIQDMEELGHFQLLGIVYRSLCHGAVQKHEVNVVYEWHYNVPQDLVMVSLCIQIAKDKMKL